MFPDFLDWPGAALNFSVQFGAGPRIPATRVGEPASAAL